MGFCVIKNFIISYDLDMFRTYETNININIAHENLNRHW